MRLLDAPVSITKRPVIDLPPGSTTLAVT